MRELFKIVFLLFCLTFTACRKQTAVLVDIASLNLSFRATYGDETLVLDNQQEYDYEGKPVRFSKINFYLANLVAINDDGETALSDIQFIDLSLTHNTAAEAESGSVIKFNKVPIGAYKYLGLGVGVPTDLNKTNPSDYATSHPLGANNSSEYLEDWNGYVFVRIEGQYDQDGDGFGSNDIAFSYLVGGRESLYRPIEFENTLVFKAGETTNLNFELDVRRLLTRPAGSLIPIIDYNPNDINEERQIIMDNFELRAFQLK